MNIKYVSVLVCVTTVLLTACGGGGSSSEGPTLDDANGSSAPDTTDTTDTAGSTNPIDLTDLIDTANTEPLATAQDGICASNTPSTQSTIGNSVLAFDADPGQCFGAKEEMGNGKRFIQTTLTGDALTATGDLLSVVGEGRLTINPNESVIGDSVSYTFAVDVTNSGSQVACINNGFLRDPFARILDAEGEELGGVRLEILGDQYQIPTDESPFIATGCIPAGETRLMMGTWTDVDSDPSAEIIASYDRVELPVEIFRLGANAERGADLSPGELSWTAFALTDEDDFFAGTYPYSVVASVQNASTQNVSVSNSFAYIYYVGNDGFLTGKESLWVSEFLGIDLDDVTPEDLTISPSGGMLSFASRDNSISNVERRSDGYRGPATRALLHVRRCFDEGCTE